MSLLIDSPRILGFPNIQRTPKSLCWKIALGKVRTYAPNKMSTMSKSASERKYTQDGKNIANYWRRGSAFSPIVGYPPLHYSAMLRYVPRDHRQLSPVTLLRYAALRTVGQLARKIS